jgi:hypothetical protein
MSRVILADFSALCGVVRTAAVGHILRRSDSAKANRVPHAAACWWLAEQKGWGATPKDPKDSFVAWHPIAATVADHPQCQMVAIGAGGEVLVDGKGDFHEERIHDPKRIEPHRRGALLGAGAVGGKAYAVGMGRAVYRRDDAHRWTAVDGGLIQPMGQTTPVGLCAIDGFAETELYAAGISGEIWTGAANAWRRIASPTDVILSAVVCAGDGQAYIGGHAGVLLRGRGEAWAVVAAGAVADDISALAWHAGRLFVATAEAVLELRGDALVPTAFGADRPATVGQLSARDGVLWSIGAKDIMQHDGTRWTRID